MAKIPPEISPGSIDSCGIQQRREKQIKDQLRIELNRRKAGDESEADATDGEEDGIRDPNFPGNDRQESDGNETNED